MSRESFTVALRAEMDAVVARYEALVRAHTEALEAARGREADALRVEIARLRAEADRLRGEAQESREEGSSLRAKVESLTQELAKAREEAARERQRSEESAAQAKEAVAEAQKRAGELAEQAREAMETAQALEGTFASERKFVEACRGLEGSLLMEALEGALGRGLDATAATYGELKGRGLSVLLTQVIKERGRSAAHAPLLEREQRALPGLAAAAGCELIVPQNGTRFSASSMEKGTTVSDSAEEGNVVACLVPGARLLGTEGALVFPKVVVATG